MTTMYRYNVHSIRVSKDIRIVIQLSFKSFCIFGFYKIEISFLIFETFKKWIIVNIDFIFF